MLWRLMVFIQVPILDTNQSGFYMVDVIAEGNYNGLGFKRTTATVFL